MKNAINTSIFVFFTILLLSNCANSPRANKSKISSNNSHPAKNITGVNNALHFIAQAKQAVLENKNTASINNLINATSKLLVQQQYTQALWLANQLSAFNLSTVDYYRLALIMSKCLTELHHNKLALQQLSKAKNFAKQGHINLSFNYYALLSKIQRMIGLKSDALIADLHTFSLNPASTVITPQYLWHKFSSLSQWQLQKIKRENPPYSKGWLALLHYANKFGDRPKQFSRFLTQWQRQYPVHPANNIIEDIRKKSALMPSTSITNIAILLPLTGKQKMAGITAQQGILAAYHNNENQKLYFFDTSTINWDTLLSHLEENKIDHIIGPLLKTNVNKFLALKPLSLPVLLLNIPDNLQLSTNQFAVSMRPEDEAIQAADTLSQLNYKHPLIISSADQVSQRISHSFIQQWQKNTTNIPETYILPRHRNSLKSIQASLDVSHSKSRIHQIKAILKQRIKVEPRNRRDIDMIYLISDHQNTRLLKPYIDVNISPFAHIIPIFASSRSQSAHSDQQGTRDLTGLKFSQIPWLLPSKQQNKNLSRLIKHLWPQRSDSLQNIFALGIDSLALLKKIPLMLQAPYLRYFGQTGILKLNSNNLLTRSLLWGEYKHNRVQEINVD